MFFKRVSSYAKPSITARINPSHDFSRGLVGCWIFNAGMGHTLHDYSTTQAHMTLNNMIHSDWVGSPRYGGLNFNGTNKYAISSAKRVNVITGTWMAWIYQFSTPPSEAVIVADTDAFDQYQYSFEVESDNTLALYWRAGGAFTNITSGTVLTNNVWMHVCVVRTSATTGNIYFNGINQSVSISGGTIPTAPLAATVAIGRANINNSSYFNGYIDDVRIWNRVLTVEEIRAVMHEPYANFISELPFLEAAAPAGAISPVFSTHGIHSTMPGGQIIR